MDRDIQRGERYGDFFDSHCNSHSATSSWSSDDPPPHHERNFDTYRGGFAGDGPHHHRRPYHNRNHPNPNHHYQLDFQNFNSEHVSVGGSGGDINPGHSLPLPGRKRQFPHSSNGASKDYIDGGSYVKLYVGGIPRTSTEEQIRSLFEEHGNIVEVVLLKDKRTGQQQECCFVKYSKLEEADRAIGALHNQYIFSAGGFSMKVKYADGERERLGGLGTHECKLYVGCINRQACKWEIEEIFSAYGHVEDVYIVRDDLRQNRGCGFVQFSHRDMAVAAMNALNGLYVMRGCEQPLIVRFAEPKRPRVGESRDNCKFGGSSIGSRFQESFVRPAPNLNDPMAGHMLPNASLSLSPKTMASSSQSPGTGCKSQSVSSTFVTELVLPSTTSSARAIAINTQTADSLDCDWSEHTCPDGYKYYYNCVTCESRWEKPEEYSFFEQQLQKPQQQQSSCQREECFLSNPHVLSTQEGSQMQRV